MIVSEGGSRPMSGYWMWWIAAAALLAAELLTGTFYLLVLGIAVAFGGVAAWFGAEPSLQWLAAGVLALAGTMSLRRWKRRLVAGTPQQPPLDIGQMVQVKTWGPENTARVAYRGSTWDAELATPTTVKAESMYIAAMRGSILILSDQRPVAG
jgi:membrane protein implicated in regulation of membrane protease activity